MKNITPSFLFFFLLLFSIPSLSQAQIEEANKEVVRSFLSGQDIENGTLTLAAEDFNGNNPLASTIAPVSIRKAYVRLVFTREKFSDTDPNWWYKINYDILSGGTVIGSDTLRINYLPGKKNYEQLAIYPMGVATNAQINITSVQKSLVPIWYPDLRLELDVVTERHYFFDPNVSSNLAVKERYSYNPTSSGVTGTVLGESNALLSWTFLEGATEYELEYAYWDDMGAVPGLTRSGENCGSFNFSNADDVDQLFSKAIRIQTAHPFYQLDVSYPQGYLVYRVRGVGRFIQNVSSDYTHKKYGAWSVPIYSCIRNNSTTFRPFENDRNWQFTTSFAEEGKWKKVISYFDGSLRNRQLQTYLNDEEKTLVAETDYTVEGQGTLSILPAPAKGEVPNLFFKPAFNRADNPAGGHPPYSFRDFDKATGADPLLKDIGAAKYFSIDNEDDGIYHDYVAESNGYPLTQARLMRDGTGRLESQGGVGDFFQLGTGRETKYFHATASSTELRRLFGEEIGLAKHYKKEAIVDPNGQASVSYIDQAGQVVATALAGEAPSNVIALDSKQGESLTQDLMETNIKSGLNSTAVNIIFNTALNNLYQFTYDLDGWRNTFNLSNGEVFCEDCEYILEVSIYGPDGKVVPITQLVNDAPTPPVNKLVQDISSNNAALTGACPTGIYNVNLIEFNATFPDLGNYEIRKILRVKPGSIADYLAELETLGIDLPDLTSYIDQHIAAIDSTQCLLVCEDPPFSDCVNDTSPPMFTNIPVDVTVSCPLTIPGRVDPMIEDNCDPSPVLTFEEAIVYNFCPNQYIISRTWTVTDNSANTSSVSQSITVWDITPPELTIPPGTDNVSNTLDEIWIACGTPLPPPITVVATDNCDGNLPVDYVETPSPNPSPYCNNGVDPDFVVRTWTAIDLCGNTAIYTKVFRYYSETLDSPPPSSDPSASPNPPLPPEAHPEDCAAAVDSAIAFTLEAECESIKERMIEQINQQGYEAELALPSGPVFINWTGSQVEIEVLPLEFLDFDGYRWIWNDGTNKFDDAEGIRASVFQISIAKRQPMFPDIIIQYTLGANRASVFGAIRRDVKNEVLWQEQWTDLLWPFHREKCHYDRCPILATNQAFDIQLLRFEAIEEAAEFLGITASSPTLSDIQNVLLGANSPDPFYSTDIAALFTCYNSRTLKAEMNLQLLTYADQLPENYPSNVNTLIEYIAYLIQEYQDPNNNPDNLDAPDEWELYRGMYLNLKQELMEQAPLPPPDFAGCNDGTCPYFNDDQAIMLRNPFYEVDTPTELDDFTDLEMQNICSETCAEKVEYWKWFIDEEISNNGNCNTAPSINWGANPLDPIEATLIAYCEQQCIALNNDLPPGSDPDVSSILYALRSSLENELITISGCSTVAYDSIINKLSELTTDGNIYEPCFQYLIDGVNQSITNGTNSYTASTDFEKDCFQSILRPASGNVFTITGYPCSELTTLTFLEEMQSGNPIPVADIQRVFGLRLVREAPYPFNIGAPANSPGIEVQVERTLPGGVGVVTAYLQGNSTACPVMIPAEYDWEINLNTVYNDCIAELVAQATADATEEWERDISDLLTEYRNQISNCNDFVVEEFSVSYYSTEHHYTLYYYDQAGNLIQTIPPEGVDVIRPSDSDYSTYFDNGGRWLTGNGGSRPLHTQATTYQYNAINQIVWQSSPDGGVSTFYYDDAQRLRLSQNAKQQANGHYSYTKYDEQSRIVEVGQVEDYTTFNLDDLNDPLFPDAAVYTNRQQTITVYDAPQAGDSPGITLTNGRGRVVKTYSENTVANDDGVRTFYSYDVHGNVKALEHQVEGLGDFQMEYDYDLISGNVKEVAYQRGQIDQFYHRYEYDADNRLTYTYTSEDGEIWENDARYLYYTHGPLARVELGEDKVQGLDYYYTLQGWIKGVNHSGNGDYPGNSSNINGKEVLGEEPGRDGYRLSENLNRNIGRDAFAYTLGYYETDYISAAYESDAESKLWSSPTNNILSSNGIKGLFNGNITAMLTDLRHFNDGSFLNVDGLQARTFQYDQLHRIRSAHAFSYTVGTNVKWILDPPTDHYKSTHTYDANGNLLTLDRWGQTGKMDELAYTYNTTNGPNQLNFVDDAIGDGAYSADVDAQQANNYVYDPIGNLESDLKGGVSKIDWTVYGKVEEVDFITGQGAFEKVNYTYDASGNRLSKQTHPRPDAVPLTVSTYYLRDASGNIMAIYEKNVQQSNAEPIIEIQQKEVSLYGSARLGHRKFSDRILGSSNNSTLFTRTRGHRSYELSNHLGNVLTVVADYKEGVAEFFNNLQATHYRPVVLNAQDYYAFGMEMPGRNFNSPDYRYGFNGKEKDERGEMGELTHYDYGFRIYNPGVGRFLSVDPLTRTYPMLTPYQFASNRPIDGIDIDGLEWGDAKNESAQTDAAFIVPLIAARAIEGVVNIAETATSHLVPNEIYAESVRRHARQQGVDIPASFSDIEVSKYYDLRFSISDGLTVEVRGGLFEEGLETFADAADIFGFSGGGAAAGSLAAKVPYSKFSDLARIALLHRKKLGLNAYDGAKHAGSKSNVAVVEYTDGEGALKQLSFMADAGGHAEQQIVDFVKNSRIDPANVTRVYTELSPCTNCSEALEQLPNARIDYSFDLKTEKPIWKKKVDQLYNYIKNIGKNKTSND